MPDIIRPCMVSNRDDSMSRPRLSDRVCCPRGMMACHARHRSTRCMLSKSDDGIHTRRILTMCIGQRPLLHATPDVLQSCILSKGDDVMPRSMSYDHVRYQRARWQAMPDIVRPCVMPKCEDSMKRLTSSDHVCF